MVIVAGHVTVEPQQRKSYLAASVSVVERARATAGCLDRAISADLIDPGRVNLFERWESQEALDTARSNSPTQPVTGDARSLRRHDRTSAARSVPVGGG